MNNIAAYPLRVQPHFRDYLWGGRKLQSRLGKTLPDKGLWAESWELIDHPEHSSLVANGELAGKSLREISRISPQWLLGQRRQDGESPSLPLLLKYLDCQRVLSVQVHPDDVYAQAMVPPDLGKTEAWYIIDAEPGSVLYAGLQPGVTSEALREAIASGTVENCLHKIEPQPGDCIFIPAGTVHALGAGLLVAEIQQASNTTFRLFDWNRVDANGQPRMLHIDQALQVIDFESGPRALQIPQPTEQAGRERMVGCNKFCLDRLAAHDDAYKIASDGNFHFLTAPGGGVELRGETFETMQLRIGESVLIPAAMHALQAVIQPGAILLDMYVGE
ncbi:MAG: type I phosphomannose isomerase catalytic subunit [Pirellulaceae bacterium]